MLHVRARGNLTPTGSDTLTLTVGTQGEPADDGDTPDYDGSDDADGDRVTCAMLNACTIDLTGVSTRATATFSDGNLRDSLTFHSI